MRVQDGKAEAWAPVQNPRAAREGVASVLGLELENVTVHQTLLGGGFGRKAKPDFVSEAAWVAQAFEGRPVKLQWTREDDVQHAFFHAVSVDHLEASLDADGNATQVTINTACHTTYWRLLNMFYFSRVQVRKL